MAESSTGDARTPVGRDGTSPTPAPPRTVLAVGVLVGVLAAVVGILAALVSRMIWRPESLSVPWGLALGVVASLAVVMAARAVSRGLGFVAAGTWIVATGLVLAGRPEGDYVFAQDWLGLTYLLVATVAVISAAAGGAPR